MRDELKDAVKQRQQSGALDGFWRSYRDKGYSRALAAGDRVIVPSQYVADQVGARHQVPLSLVHGHVFGVFQLEGAIAFVRLRPTLSAGETIFETLAMCQLRSGASAASGGSGWAGSWP